MIQDLPKPASIKTTRSITIFSVEEPIELVKTKDVDGKVSQYWRTQVFYFTTHDRPITVDGHQYIPLSSFDQVRWDTVVDA